MRFASLLKVTILALLLAPTSAYASSLFQSGVPGSHGFAYFPFWQQVLTDMAAAEPPSAAHADAAQIEASVASWTRQMTLIDARLAHTGAYVAGPAFTLADVVIGLATHRWLMTPIARPDLPAVAAYYDRLSDRAAFRAHGRNGVP